MTRLIWHVVIPEWSNEPPCGFPLFHEKVKSCCINCRFVVESKIVALKHQRRSTDNVLPGGKSSHRKVKHGLCHRKGWTARLLSLRICRTCGHWVSLISFSSRLYCTSVLTTNMSAEESSPKDYCSQFGPACDHTEAVTRPHNCRRILIRRHRWKACQQQRVERAAPNAYKQLAQLD